MVLVDLARRKELHITNEFSICFKQYVFLRAQNLDQLWEHKSTFLEELPEEWVWFVLFYYILVFLLCLEATSPSVISWPQNKKTSVRIDRAQLQLDHPNSCLWPTLFWKDVVFLLYCFDVCLILKKEENAALLKTMWHQTCAFYSRPSQQNVPGILGCCSFTGPNMIIW